MMKSKKVFPVEEAKKKLIYCTGILDRFIGGQINIIHYRASNDETRAIYKVQKGLEIIIFKSIQCPNDDRDAINRAKNEYEICSHCSKLTEGVAKPIEKREAEIEITDRYVMEALYEYCGVNLLSILGKVDGKEIMCIMSQLLIPMMVLEDNGFFHSDLKPDNVAISNGIVKILDFGVSISFDTSSKLFYSKTMIGGTDVYCPPEVLRLEKCHPDSVDVFCWGMTFYQLIGNKSFEDLRSDMILRKTIGDYGKFMDNVRNITIKGDIDGSLKKKVVGILSDVLNEDYRKRPTFNELKGIMTKREGEIQPESERQLACAEEAYKMISSGKDTSSLLNKGIGDAGIKIIVKALSESKTLTYLVLGFNKIGVEGATILADGIKSCPTLRELYLGFYNTLALVLEDSTAAVREAMGPKVAEASNFDKFFPRHRPNPRIWIYFIENKNNLRADGTKAIAKALESSSLQTLDLGYCNVSADGINDLLKATDNCKTLKWICLEENQELAGKKYPFRSKLRVRY